MADLAAWLLEQIEADVAVARACIGINELAAHINGAPIPRWVYDSMQIHSDDERPIVRVGKTWAAEGAHIARWDPARVLAECEAKRRIVWGHWTIGVAYVKAGRHLADGEHLDWATGCGGCSNQPEPSWPCPTLRLLAQPYADRPGFREEWRLATRAGADA